MPNLDQGQFRRELPDPTVLFVATKWCVFHKCIPTREFVLEAVKGRLRDLQTTRVDLLQVWELHYSRLLHVD